MNNLKINNCFFHGIRDSIKRTPLETLELILKRRSILTTNSLRLEGLPHEREVFSFQGNNAVSICFHPNNESLYKKFYNTSNTITYEPPAFEQFVRDKYPSIILHPIIINELKVRGQTGYKRMLDEIQILENIPLSYMIGIGYGNSTLRMIDSLPWLNENTEKSQLKENINNICRLFGNDLEVSFNDYNNTINIINNLLKKYDYRLPIIDPETGKPYSNIQRMQREIRKGICLVKK